MARSEIKNWLQYWKNAGLVAVDEIRAFDQVYQARKFCRVMRDGVFAEITDLQIWRALEELRSNEAPAGAA